MLQMRISGQNAKPQNPITKNAQNPKTPTPKLQTHKSAAFHTLTFYPWHYDRIPRSESLLL